MIDMIERGCLPGPLSSQWAGILDMQCQYCISRCTYILALLVIGRLVVVPVAPRNPPQKMLDCPATGGRRYWAAGMVTYVPVQTVLPEAPK